mmetsp:Transcript_13516/g.22477  ORF Transcript_13516/g.22477 Transcript_13516/m.22477 type:complete len:703 (+) Transcript_13516:98-2206(+)
MAFMAGDTSCPCCFRPGLDRPAICMPVGGPQASRSKIDVIRQLLKVHGIGAYVQPMGDAHTSEYISDADKRVEWLTSFTGSAGTAVVTADQALLWTDGRYFTQAAEQLEGTGFELMKMSEPGVPDLEEWAKDAKLLVGVDPTLISLSAAEEWSRKGCADFKLVEHNLVDRAWGEMKPKRSASALRTHGTAHSGESVASKVMRVAEALKEKGCTSLVLNALDQICWLFNLRGADIECNPVFFAYAVVNVNGAVVNVTLFLRALDDDVRDAATKEAVNAYLVAEGCNGGKEAAVTLEAYSSFNAATAARLAGCNDKEAKVMLERATTTLAMAADIAPEQRVLVDASPVELFKAKKNEVERRGLERAGRKDAAAVVSYFAWLERTLLEGTTVTEAEGADEISARRSGMDGWVGDSFPTISSTGANAAVIHYHAEHANCKPIDVNSVYLCDTGGQYLDGTTDITRTLHFGSKIPSEDEKRAYTRVLQGHIALAKAVFPAGTPGIMLEMLARGPLWKDGMNFLHGTGHGIGAFLNVHEGPFSVGGGAVHASKIVESARMRRMYLAPIEEGYHLSDEPGFYKEGDHGFGIRIEADLIAEAATTRYAWGARSYLSFRYLSPVPMCRALIDLELMTNEEVAWVDALHKRCREEITEELLKAAAVNGQCGAAGVEADAKAAKDWLLSATEPLHLADAPPVKRVSGRKRASS